MAKTKIITTRINPVVKEQVEEILKEVGLSTSEAINLFFNQIRLQKGLPFKISVPKESDVSQKRKT